MSRPTIAPDTIKWDKPLTELRNAYPDHDRLVVGVAVTDAASTPKKLLLLQRTATEDTLPLMFEIPGGTADDGTDRTILDTVSRETLEETGLRVTRILRDFEGFEYETKKGRTMQINFLVEVAEPEGELGVKINPDEHDAFVWVSGEEELTGLPITESMRKVVGDALKLL